MLLIKNATAAHIDLIRALTMQVWPQTYTPILGDEQAAYMLDKFYTPASLQQQMQDGQQFIIAYDDDNEAVAFAAYGQADPGVTKLHKLYVLPTQQGKGIAGSIIKHIVAATAGKANTLRLNVNIHNQQAIGFYTKFGFVKAWDEDIDIGHGYYMNDHVLEMHLG